MGQDIYTRIIEKNRKHQEKQNENLKDRVRYEAKDTLKFVERMRDKGKSDKDITREINKYHQQFNKKND